MVENLVELANLNGLIPYFTALVLVTIFLVLAQHREPGPGKTPASIYAAIGIVLTFGCGAIFNVVIVSIQDPQKAGTLLFAVAGSFFIGIAIVLSRFLNRKR